MLPRPTDSLGPALGSRRTFDYASTADGLMAGVVLHIGRETIHHGAEIALRRDLHRRR